MRSCRSQNSFPDFSLLLQWIPGVPKIRSCNRLFVPGVPKKRSYRLPYSYMQFPAHSIFVPERLPLVKTGTGCSWTVPKNGFRKCPGSPGSPTASRISGLPNYKFSHVFFFILSLELPGSRGALLVTSSELSLRFPVRSLLCSLFLLIPKIPGNSKIFEEDI